MNEKLSTQAIRKGMSLDVVSRLIVEEAAMDLGKEEAQAESNPLGTWDAVPSDSSLGFPGFVPVSDEEHARHLATLVEFTKSVSKIPTPNEEQPALPPLPLIFPWCPECKTSMSLDDYTEKEEPVYKCRTCFHTYAEYDINKRPEDAESFSLWLAQNHDSLPEPHSFSQYLAVTGDSLP